MATRFDYLTGKVEKGKYSLNLEEAYEYFIRAALTNMGYSEVEMGMVEINDDTRISFSGAGVHMEKRDGDGWTDAGGLDDMTSIGGDKFLYRAIRAALHVHFGI